MALTKVHPHADHKRGGAEYKQESSRDGGYSKVSDGKFYARKSGEMAPETQADGPRNTNSFTVSQYRDRGTEYHQHSAKTDGMCK